MLMYGPAPLRRTLNYLKSGKFIAKDNVKIMEVHYSLRGWNGLERGANKKDYFHGLREFYFWEMPLIQYKNPKLQIVRFLDKFPTPMIRFWREDGTDVTLDCFNQSREQIAERVLKVAGKSKERIELETTIQKDIVGEENPAIFGFRRQRFCMCEVPGQHPCPGVIRVPTFDQLEVDIGGRIV